MRTWPMSLVQSWLCQFSARRTSQTCSCDLSCRFSRSQKRRGNHGRPQRILVTSRLYLCACSSSSCCCARRSRYRCGTFSHYSWHVFGLRCSAISTSSYCCCYRYCCRRLHYYLSASHGPRQHLVCHFVGRREFRLHSSYRQRHARHRRRWIFRRRYRQFRPSYRLSPRINQRFHLCHHGRNFRFRRTFCSYSDFCRTLIPHAQSRLRHPRQQQPTFHHRSFLLDARPSCGQYYGDDWTRSGYRHHSASALLWRHQYDLYCFCFRPRFAIFVLY